MPPAAAQERPAPERTAPRRDSTATARQGAAFERVYAVGLQDETRAEALVVKLNGIDGVQGVELRRA